MFVPQDSYHISTDLSNDVVLYWFCSVLLEIHWIIVLSQKIHVLSLHLVKHLNSWIGATLFNSKVYVLLTFIEMIVALIHSTKHLRKIKQSWKSSELCNEVSSKYIYGMK